MSVGNLNKRLFVFYFTFFFILFYFFKSLSLVFSNPIAVKKKKKRGRKVDGAASGGLDTVSNCLSCLMCITLFSKVQYLSPSIEGAGWYPERGTPYGGLQKILPPRPFKWEQTF